MKAQLRAGVWTGFLLAAASALAETGGASWLSVGGLAFGDAYHLPSHHLESGDGATGAVLRRGYLTFDADGGGRWDGRLRLELNQSGAFETYDMELDIKDLWVGTDLGSQRLVLGLAPTPTFATIESLWGKRYLMRTPMDLQGVASRDTGVSISGPLGSSGALSYQAMVGSGIEFGAEAGDGRKLMVAVDWQLTERWLAQLYVDEERLAGPTDRTTVQGFLAYQGEGWRWGAQYSDQDREEDSPLRLSSTFVVKSLGGPWQAIGRIDRIHEPSPRGDNISYIPFDPTAPATLFLAGAEFALSERVSITPNVVVIDYDRREDGSSPQTDVYLRLTAFFNFE